MTIYSYVSKTVEQGGWSGVCRFDSELRKAFPEIKSITPGRLPKFETGDIVIADNHLCLDIPEEIKVIVVHHGSAQCHYARDATWRSDATKAIVEKQSAMRHRPNTVFVAPSLWVAERFHATDDARIIPHWVPSIPLSPRFGKPKIIGDWRDGNKGLNVWRKIAAMLPDFEFRPLKFCDQSGKRKQYGEASLYLSLSLSEGCCYGMADAEGAGLPIVSTDTGAYKEFSDCAVIEWAKRDAVIPIAATIRSKLAAGRQELPFYEAFTYDAWKAAWSEVIAQCR
jgi:hypothetical protein